jgi:hypothetical protein
MNTPELPITPQEIDVDEIKNDVTKSSLISELVKRAQNWSPENDFEPEES